MKINKYIKFKYLFFFYIDFLIFNFLWRNNFFNLKNNGRVSTFSIASYTTRDTVENFYSYHIYYRNKSNKALGQAFFTFDITVVNKSECNTIVVRVIYLIIFIKKILIP